MAARFRVPGLGSLIPGLKTVCRIINAHAATVRLFVPAGSLTAYDNAISAILTACDVIRAIEYTDTADNTNAPWGAK